MKKVKTYVELEKLLRVSEKIIRFLEKKTHRDVALAYNVCRFLCVYFEVAEGCELVSPSDTELRAFVSDMLKDSH